LRAQHYDNRRPGLRNAGARRRRRKYRISTSPLRPRGAGKLDVAASQVEIAEATERLWTASEAVEAKSK